MKIFLTACIILVQFFGVNTVAANTVVTNNSAAPVQKTKEFSFSAAALNITDHPAENAHTQAGVPSLKTREQRFQFYILVSQVLQLLTTQPTKILNSFSDAPAPTSIGRYLLFPKHYFW